MGDGSQIANWSVGLRFGIGVGPYSETAKANFLAAVEASVKQFHQKSEVSAGSYAYLKMLTAAYIDVDGRYLGGDGQDTTERAVSGSPPGVTANPVSFDVARTYTLRTNAPRGRGSKGRIYYPVNQIVSSDGRWTQSIAAQAADAFKILVDQLNLACDEQWSTSTGLSVFSPYGITNVVTQISVGRSPDTQRRRTRKHREDPEYKTITPLAAALSSGALVTDKTYTSSRG